jgi:hypothetical protein
LPGSTNLAMAPAIRPKTAHVRMLYIIILPWKYCLGNIALQLDASVHRNAMPSRISRQLASR